MDAPPIEPPLDPTAPGSPDPAPRPPPPRPRAGSARRSDDRLLGGVAGGVAEYLGIDVLLVRLGFVVTAFFGGLGVIAYLLGWIVLPVAPSATASPPSGDRRQLLGYGLVALGLLAIGGRFGWSFGGDGAFWPLVLIGLGAAVLWLRTRDLAHGTARRTTGAPATPAPTEPTVTRWSPRRSRPSRRRARPPRPRAARPDRGRTSARSRGACSWCSPAARGCSTPPAWSTWISAWCSRSRWRLVGVALVVSAWFGRSRGLIALGIPLVLVVGGFGLVDVPLAGGIGDPTYHPRSVAAVDGLYTLAIGNLSVDLRDVDFSGTRRHVHAQLGIGHLDVTVPEGVRVVVDGHAGAGNITAFGEAVGRVLPDRRPRRAAGCGRLAARCTSTPTSASGTSRSDDARRRSVERHDLDPVALVFGATFVVLGLAYAIARWTWIDFDGGWVLGAFLVALGVAGVVSVTARHRRRMNRADSLSAVHAARVRWRYPIPAPCDRRVSQAWRPPDDVIARQATRPVAWLELFYDLVFVAAVVTFSDAISFEPNLGRIGAVDAAFAATWLIWLATTLHAEPLPRRRRRAARARAGADAPAHRERAGGRRRLRGAPCADLGDVRAPRARRRR